MKSIELLQRESPEKNEKILKKEYLRKGSGLSKKIASNLVKKKLGEDQV